MTTTEKEKEILSQLKARIEEIKPELHYDFEMGYDDEIHMKEKKLLNLDEACEYLGITKRHMNTLTSQKRITFINCGGRKFRREWLDEFIESNKTNKRSVTWNSNCIRN